MFKSVIGPVRTRLVLSLFCVLLPVVSEAAGTWTPLASSPPSGINNCMLLSDGTVLGMNGDGGCVKLTPDIHGGYINGTWSTMSTMNQSRLFFASQLLTNGNLWVAGGEYGSGGTVELYDSLNNTWALITPPSNGPDFYDAISQILPNGNPLVCPVLTGTACQIFNVPSSNWLSAGSVHASQDEADWIKLPSDAIITIDFNSQNSEHYVPTMNQWIVDGAVPVPLYDSSLGEIGSGHLLPNGQVFWIGSTTNTARYTPGATPSSAGSWVALSGIPNGLGAPDAPAAMMVNGKILCCLGPTATYSGPCSFYEYDYTSDTFTQVTAPGGGSTYNNSAPFGTSMLDLPDGTVLFVGGQNSGSLFVYTPDGTPLAAGQPAINSITENADGSYQLTGTNLNGISEGAAYGDDEQMNGNYPLVRMTNNSSANVYYARTYNWNSTSVQTASRVVTAQFTLPQNMPAGTYSLVVTAVGNPSAPQTFTYAPPPVPTGLSAASGSNGFVNLQWNTSSGATAYNVKRALRSTGFFATIATTNGTTFTDTGLSNGLTYYYKVAAIGSSGPSSDSAAVSAKPAGPPPIPGATNVILSPYYNRNAIYTDGITFSGGADGGGFAFSANLLGPDVLWNNLVFPFGPANANDSVSCAGQVINLPAGNFNTLQLLATAVNGSQTALFTVTYTDSSTATFTQSFSDWANSQAYPGEFTVVSMPYRDSGSGGNQTLNMTVDGYVFTLNPAKTVKSITLPINSNLILLSMLLATDPATVSLTGYYNRAGIYTDGTSFTNPATGGLDGSGSAYSGTLLTGALKWSNSVFAFGPQNATNVVSCTNQTIPLPPGNYSRLQMLAAGVNNGSGQVSQSFVITYTDSSTATFVQSLSDWHIPQTFTGESRAVIMDHRNGSNGSASIGAFYLYGYSFALTSAKTVQSIRLPNNANVEVTAISLVPNWPPTFRVNPLTLPSVNAGVTYFGTIATNASDLNGDILTFAKVSGPAWLTVAGSGTLSGTPLSPDVGSNIFSVSVTDPGGMSSTATLNINVIAAPPIFSTLSPQSDGSLLLSWTGGIAPYDVQFTTNLAPTSWQDFSGTIGSNSFSLLPTNGVMFYRVGGE